MMQHPLEISLLGHVEFRRKGQLLPKFVTRKSEALFIYLAQTGHPHSRDVLAELLWPERTMKQSRRNLRATLSRLRQVVGDYVISDQTALSFNQALPFWLDTTELGQQVATFSPAGPLSSAQVAQLADALTLYTGDFLAGFPLKDAPDFEAWVTLERERLHHQTVSGIHRLIDAFITMGDYPAGITWSRRLLAMDDLDERGHKQLIRLLAYNEQHHMAQAHYAHYRQHLMTEMGVAPNFELAPLLAPPPPVSNLANPAKTQKQPALPRKSGPKATSPFVARAAELTYLAGALQTALTGHSQMRFVVGEAGSGKTTLIHQFVQQAQQTIPDLLVLSGHCDSYVGQGDAYAPFAEALSMLLKPNEPDEPHGLAPVQQADHSPQALSLALSLIIEYGPDLIDTFVPARMVQQHRHLLPDHLAAHLPPIKAKTADMSFTRAPLLPQYSAVIRAIAAHQPILLVIEDLHWVDPASARLLFHLSQKIKDRPIFIIGTYRPEETMDDHHQPRHPMAAITGELKRQQGQIWLDLGKRSADEGRHFIDAYLDTHPNRFDESFRQQLWQHTAGHALFTVELMRDLKARQELQQNEAGEWIAAETIQWETLPARVEGVIEHRVNRLSNQLRQTLMIAAVQGNQFTGEVVAQAQQTPLSQVMGQLHQLDKQHDLIQSDGVEHLTEKTVARYSFRHHLIQTYLYQRLNKSNLTRLHQAVGYGLEQVYEGQVETVALQMVRHFEQAGLPDKAADYLLVSVAERALQTGAQHETIAHLERALALKSKGGRAIPPAWLAHRAWLLGEAHYRLGQVKQGQAHLEATLAYLNMPVPTTRLSLMMALFKAACSQGWFILRTQRGNISSQATDASNPDKATLSIVVRTYERLMQIYFMGNQLGLVMYADLHRFNRAIQGGISPELARAYAGLYGTYTILRLGRLAETFRLKAQAMAKEVNDLPTLTTAIFVPNAQDIGLHYRSWAENQADHEKAIQLYKQLNDKRGWGDALTSLALLSFFQANFRLGVEIGDKVNRLGVENENLEHEAWGLVLQALHWLPLGQADQAVSLLETAQPLLKANTQSQSGEIVHQGLLAWAYQRQGQFDKAKQIADTTASTLAQSALVPYTLIYGYIGVLEVYLALWENAQTTNATVKARNLQQQVKPILRAFHRFSWLLPVGRPAFWLYQGQAQWLRGRPLQARRAWQKSLTQAKRLEMPYQAGLAHHKLSRHLPPQHPQLHTHHSRTIEIFTALEATEDLALAQTVATQK